MFSKKMKNKLIIFTFLFGLISLNCSKDEPDILTPIDENLEIIDLNNTQQVIRGFGGISIPGWEHGMTPDQVNTAFGNGAGQLGLTILRIRVPYNQAEFSMEVPNAKLAISLGAIVFASPWTPPPSMKSNNNIVGGTLNENSYGAFADYLRSFADYLASNGAPLYAISIQNEPDVSVTYESCSWDASQMLKFIKNNATTVGARIIAPESFNFNHTISDAILNDPIASKNLAIIGGHIYGGGLTPYPLAVSKGKEIWMTEHLDLNTNWDAAYSTGQEINDCLNAGMNAYLWWYIVRYYGPIDESGNVTKRGYVISQFSKFIRPEFIKIGCTAITKSNLDVTAYKKDSKIVLVVLNRNYEDTTQTFVIKNGSAAAFTPYVTSENKNCAQGSDIFVVNGSFSAVFEKSSVTTLVSK
jgi:glucuronoarabinoxylan endo-1,4-beta-xylanase